MFQLSPRKAWIELELVDDAGAPVAAEPYRVVDSKGKVHEGALDGQGFARVAPIALGRCTVTFPGLDRSEWGRTGADAGGPAAGDEVAWLEIEVVDAAGAPLAGERYEVVLADGEREAGLLDRNGRARLEGIPAGSCKVSLPDVDGSDWELAAATGAA